MTPTGVPSTSDTMNGHVFEVSFDDVDADDNDEHEHEHEHEQQQQQQQ
jgi:hypothetical protein